MLHSLYNIYLHVIFITKYRQPLINEGLEKRLFERITGLFEEEGCKVRAINGVEDHLHVLIEANPKKGISEVVRRVKGNTSFWVNQNKLTERRFSWKTGYSVFSVSDFHVPTIVKYIERQKEHHSRDTQDFSPGRRKNTDD